MNNLMIDLETLGTDPSAPIIAIGAVFFDPKTGKLGAEFSATIDFESACERRTPSDSTIKWWLVQSSDARAKVLRGEQHMVTALRDFTNFVDENIKRSNVKPWGNGATFDISMLEDCFKCYDLPTPWKYYNVRDVRTIVDLGKMKGFDRDDIEFEGTPHVALDDAKHQARYVSFITQGLLL
jgi:exodeoxyribonuclease VIII